MRDTWEEEEKEEEGWEIRQICVFIMGCLVSRRWQGDGGMETAVPLLPRKQEKCWTLKKMTYSYMAVIIFILYVCV